MARKDSAMGKIRTKSILDGEDTSTETLGHRPLSHETRSHPHPPPGHLRHLYTSPPLGCDKRLNSGGVSFSHLQPQGLAQDSLHTQKIIHPKCQQTQRQ